MQDRGGAPSGPSAAGACPGLSFGACHTLIKDRILGMLRACLPSWCGLLQFFLEEKLGLHVGYGHGQFARRHADEASDSQMTMIGIGNTFLSAACGMLSTERKVVSVLFMVMLGLTEILAIDQVAAT